ncbi:hypothetical protein FB45DRAFT_1007742 [Roridomyces roridus]|uniref:Uncharacterized protein n=1 Tax=Roridomyces roridus TaxID=1738132 RepID=A0AAD7BCC6_9AGAR|nr:hypothetical protein FB45DRAFT_1007742 [Roridomyces roridus]
MDKIRDFATDIALIQDVEFFARNFGALGASTALRVQNLLAEITPDSPEANLPVEFNAWLRDLQGTSRATNVYNYYKKQMKKVKDATGAGPPNVKCFPVYAATANLLPAPPTFPSCDMPGTKGRFMITRDYAGNPVYSAAAAWTIMGSGNAQYYALGPGTSLAAGEHFIVNDLSTSCNGHCNGVYEMALAPAGTGYSAANIELNCNGQTGNKLVAASFHFVVNGQQLQCVVINKNDGTNAYFTIYGPTVAAAKTCANAAVTEELAAMYPNADLSSADFGIDPS